jgi:Carboxypeptidase regulatory-like domain
MNQETGAQRLSKTDTAGLFSFPSIQPGVYSVLIKATGFKELAKKDLHLSASQRLSAGGKVIFHWMK